MHINKRIVTARKGIGAILHLAPYLPLKSCDQIYKMHVRPHLDYCDIIYHIPVIPNEFDSSQSLNYQMNALERTQYIAALAVSGAWEGTNLNKLCEELGRETITHRRLVIRLTQFYKTMNNLTPEYLRSPIPSLKPYLFGHRSTNVLHTISCRTVKYRNSFYSGSVISWNNISPELRGAESLLVFKRNITKLFHREKKSLFNITSPNGTRWIFQLRVGLSPLKCHKKITSF